MRNAFIVLAVGLSLVGAGCLPTTRTTEQYRHAPIGSPVTLSVGEKVTFEGAFLNVELTSISDSRCPKDVQCIWAGELSPNLYFSGESIDELTPQHGAVTLGTTTRLHSDIPGSDYHSVTLITATETTATIQVDTK